MSDDVLEQRIRKMESEIAAVKTAWTVLKYIGTIALAIVGVWAAIKGH